MQFEEHREIALKKHLHEGELKLEDCLDEFVICRVEIVEEPGVVALQLCSHVLIVLILAQFFLVQAAGLWEAVFDLEAVLAGHGNAEAFFLLFDQALFTFCQEILAT